MTGGKGKEESTSLLEWTDTTIVEWLEKDSQGQEKGAPGVYRLSQRPYANSREAAAEESGMQGSRPGTGVAPANSSSAKLSCTGEIPLLETFPSLELKREGDGPYSFNRVF